MKDELLIKFLLKETSPEEDLEVHNWLKQSPDNTKKLAQFKIIWESSKTLALQHPIDEEAAWNRFKELRDQEVKQPLPNDNDEPPIKVDEPPIKVLATPKTNTTTQWLKVAASVIISFGLLLGIYWYTIAPKHPYFNTIEWVATTATLTDTLPDGTGITLNKHSKITFQEKLFGWKRQVKMTGEVFFDVASNASKPFEVQTDNLTIRVLGTSFNVRSNPKATEVIVETGAVQVSRDDVIVKLKPDEKAIARTGLTTIEQRKQTDKLYDYYRTKQFKLDNTPLWRFVEVLNEAYSVKIVIGDPAIGNLPISTIFDNDSLNTILDTLCSMLQLHVVKNGKTITIKK
ncbi:FecR domain-containing protein [Olivibacter ginsenosidimutans]|uniref:FecR domain-containing protein n=1 Tax=Olivibacter ginsenosidimutans TaxID=1176537 RepID=A0ABP9BGV1_9SPHI